MNGHGTRKIVDMAAELVELMECGTQEPVFGFVVLCICHMPERTPLC